MYLKKIFSYQHFMIIKVKFNKKNIKAMNESDIKADRRIRQKVV